MLFGGQGIYPHKVFYHQCCQTPAVRKKCLCYACAMSDVSHRHAHVLTLVYWSFSWLISVLWHCWLGGRKGIRPVKTEWWGTGMVMCLKRGVDLHMVQLMPLPLTFSCSSKSRLVLPFWYWLTRVVLADKWPLNGCCCCCCCCYCFLVNLSDCP